MAIRGPRVAGPVMRFRLVRVSRTIGSVGGGPCPETQRRGLSQDPLSSILQEVLSPMFWISIVVLGAALGSLFLCRTFGWCEGGRSLGFRWYLSLVLACYLTSLATWSHGNLMARTQARQLLRYHEALVAVRNCLENDATEACVNALGGYLQRAEVSAAPWDALPDLILRLAAIQDGSDGKKGRD